MSEVNDWIGFFSFKPTKVLKWLMESPCKTTCLYTGNQFGKNEHVVMDYIFRIVGWHPNKEKCIKPEDAIRTFRFASQSLPGEKEEDEVRNTQYPAFKRRFPLSLIRKEITTRKPVMSIESFNPKTNQSAGNVNIEYVSFSQDVQVMAGVQRRCIAKGQRVLLSNGIWKNIEDIKEGDELICEALGGFADRQRTNRVRKVWLSGDREVYKVNCQKGITFSITRDHRMMVVNSGKSSYKSLNELDVGDKIVCKMPNIEGRATMPEWLIKWIAAILGDGHTNDRGIFLTSKSERFVNDLRKCLPDGRVKQVRFQKHGTPQYRIVCKELKEYLVNNKLYGKKANEKFVPDEIFTLDDNGIKLFLSYLYQTDGWASGHIIGYCSTSYRLSQDVFLLLRRLKIQSTIYTKKQIGNWKEQYWVLVSSYKNVLAFIDKVGIVFKEDFIKEVMSEAKRRKEVRVTSGNTKIKNYVKIKSIEYSGVMPTYDIEMESGGWDSREKNGLKKQRTKARSPRNNFLIQGGAVSHNSIWIDEECNKDFYEEQPPRLLASDGDMIFTFTPVPGSIGWEYDEFYERAKYIYRTEKVRERLKKRYGEDYPECQVTDSIHDVCVIMAATDDNPIYEDLAAEKSKHLGKTITATEYIDSIFSIYDDEDIIDARRYGLFRQLSGKIYKSFNQKLHVIEQSKYFPEGMPHGWKYARGIDHHESNPWACVWLAVSPENEIFVWCDYSAKTNNVTYDIALEIASRSGDYKYIVNLIDPNAQKKQNSSNMSTVDDLNRHFIEFRKDGRCMGGHWESWDTHGTRGREEVTMRLLNSAKVGKPFNNRIVEGGRVVNLPTIWFTDNCRATIDSFKNWRRDNWIKREAEFKNDSKETPITRWSHFPIAIECLLKNPLLTKPKFGSLDSEPIRQKYKGVSSR